MGLQRVIRDRRLTPEEAAKYREIREQVAEELPELIASHHERTEPVDPLPHLVEELRAAREACGMSVADVTRATGLDAAEIATLESGQRPATVDTLNRYAHAVGKRVVISLTDA